MYYFVTTVQIFSKRTRDFGEILLSCIEEAKKGRLEKHRPKISLIWLTS